MEKILTPLSESILKIIIIEKTTKPWQSFYIVYKKSIEEYEYLIRSEKYDDFISFARESKGAHLKRSINDLIEKGIISKLNR